MTARGTSNWQSLGADGLGMGTPLGQGPQMPIARSELEATRMGVGRTPQAEYPDGYLGTISNPRREDRLLDSMKTRVNQRSYQRGVHKGERIDQADYFYPESFNPQMGLYRQARAARIKGSPMPTEKFTPVAQMEQPPMLVNDGKANLVSDIPMQVDADRQSRLSRLMPAWR